MAWRGSRQCQIQILSIVSSQLIHRPYRPSSICGYLLETEMKFKSYLVVALGLCAVVTPQVKAFLSFQSAPILSSSAQRSEKGEEAVHTEKRAAVSRRNALTFMLSIASSSLLGTMMVPFSASAKSYSANARNLERLNAGDASGGSVYDNNPTSEKARKRRAMTGCKIPSAREEAAEVLGLMTVSEKDCNQRVMAGESDFMLQAMQKLECPTCPYGIAEKR